MTVEIFKSGGRLEGIGAYSRAKRVGPFVYVAGTTAIEPSGRLHAPGDVARDSFDDLGLLIQELEENVSV